MLVSFGTTGNDAKKDETEADIGGTGGRGGGGDLSMKEGCL